MPNIPISPTPFINDHAALQTGVHGISIASGKTFTTSDAVTIAGSKVSLNGTQIVYHSTDFFSIILGDGGNNLLHTTAAEGWYNTFIGSSAGGTNTTGSLNVFIGMQAGILNTSGYFNTYIGGNSGIANTTGYENTFVGQATGTLNTIGTDNVFIGQWTGRDNLTGSQNTFIGQEAGNLSSIGNTSTYLGSQSGHNSNGSGNVFLGFSSGYYETGNNTLIIDNIKRLDEPATRSKALIYGIFDAAVENQYLVINGSVGVGTITAAPSGKLTVYHATNTPPSLTSGVFAPFIVNNAGVEITMGTDSSSPYEAWMQSKNGNAAWFLAINPLGGNVGIGTTTDGMTAGGSLAIAKDLAHRGTLAGLFNHAVAAQPTTASFGVWTTLANVVTALQSLGILGV